MATISPTPPKTKVDEPTEGKGDGFGKRTLEGGWEDGPEGRRSDRDQRYYTGMFIGLAGIIMIFAAFSSAYVVRKGLSDDWQSTSLPRILWPNTLVLLASSLTLEKARRSWRAPRQFSGWWLGTVGLGVAFLLGQLLAWQQLAQSGVFLKSNPSSSFFYVLTASHAVHLLGGVAALCLVSWKIWRGHHVASRSTVLGVTAMYWHFMDGLWIYVFLLLLIGR